MASLIGISFSKYFSPRKKIYPQYQKGRFRQLKSRLNIFFLIFYGILPFLRFDRGEESPNQAILLDFTTRKIYFFKLEIWPSEIYFLAIILIVAAITLFFITALFGRIWCGYLCFQTVWSDLFMQIANFFQGDRNRQIIADRHFNLRNFLAKLATHFCWALLSLATGFIFISYFNDVFDLIDFLINLKLSLAQAGWMVGIASTTYLMAGFAREQVCIYMCPYAKFQSAMFDKDTLIIGYDTARGEPRGKANKNQDFTDRGHCIECWQCVNVCPQGIDIRNGLQMECIACGLCIDACDNIMEKMNLPKGLIRYDNAINFNNITKQEAEKSTLLRNSSRLRIWRPRTFYYLAILSIIFLIVVFSLVNKSNIDLRITNRARPTSVLLKDGSIRNGYDFNLTNKLYKDFDIEITAPSGFLIVNDSKARNHPEQEIELKTTAHFDIKKNSKNNLRFFLVADKNTVEQTTRKESNQNSMKIDNKVAKLTVKIKSSEPFIAREEALPFYF